MKFDMVACKQALPMPELGRALHLDPWMKGDRDDLICSPFRADGKPSFSIFSKSGSWGFKDHASDDSGDEVTLIMRATGKNKKEAMEHYHELANVPVLADGSFSGESKQGKGSAFDPIVDVWNYVLADGRLHHQTVKTRDKKFFQRRPAQEAEQCGNKQAKRDKKTGNWWLWTLQGITPVLYRVPELLKRSDEKLWICEGEKDAEALARSTSSGQAAGFLTTTCPMGAGAWRDCYTRFLLERTGREVVLCQDADAKGEEATKKLNAILSRAGFTVGVLDWDLVAREFNVQVSEKFDVSDLIGTPGTG
ncbi:MAG: toprim domain-containing protein [Verrucomicrobiota bacterium]